jgi:hypothetical protein
MSVIFLVFVINLTLASRSCDRSFCNFTCRLYTRPFGNSIGGLFSSIFLPLIRHTILELTWCDNGSDLANAPKVFLSQTGQFKFLSSCCWHCGVLSADRPACNVIESNGWEVRQQSAKLSALNWSISNFHLLGSYKL